MPAGRLVVMGRVLGPWGVSGWVRLRPYTESPELLAAQRSWWIGKEGSWHEAIDTEFQRRGTRLLARFAGCATPEAARAYQGMEIALQRESLPPAGTNEFYLADLIGLDVVNADGERLGTLFDMFSNGAHEVMRVSDGEMQRLLPFVGQVVRDVDLEAGRILVEWGKDW